MRILTICQMGNKRSVVTRFVLEHNHDVIAAGTDTNSLDTLNMLSAWADTILLSENEMIAAIPIKHRTKVDLKFDIGPDIYPSSIDKHLYRSVKKQLIQLGYVT